MMDIPDAFNLLDAARESLVSQLLPALPREQRYLGLMIANALAIAARECSQRNGVIDREIEWLRRMLGPDVPPIEGTRTAELAALRRAVAIAIRAGRHDAADDQTALTAELLHVAADWLAISNPKALRK